MIKSRKAVPSTPPFRPAVRLLFLVFPKCLRVSALSLLEGRVQYKQKIINQIFNYLQLFPRCLKIKKPETAAEGKQLLEGHKSLQPCSRQGEKREDSFMHTSSQGAWWGIEPHCGGLCPSVAPSPGTSGWAKAALHSQVLPMIPPPHLVLLLLPRGSRSNAGSESKATNISISPSVQPRVRRWHVSLQGRGDTPSSPSPLYPTPSWYQLSPVT